MIDPTVADARILLGLSSHEFILGCYRRILHREGDPSGIAYYTSKITTGADRIAVAAEIASSEEALCLPASRKAGVAEFLALHASQLIESARTTSRRRRAVERITRYFDVLAGPAAKADAGGDPFSTYLHEVIEERTSS